MLCFPPRRRRRRRPEDAPGAAERGALPEEFPTQPGHGWGWPWRNTGIRYSPGTGHTGIRHSPGTGHTGIRYSPGTGHTGIRYSPGTGHTGIRHSPGTGHTGIRHSPGTGHTGIRHSPGTGHTGIRYSPGTGHTGTRHSPGTGHTGRDAGIPGEAGAGPGCAQVNGKGPGNGGARQERAQAGNGPSGSRALGKGSGDEPGVPRQAGNGNVPREGTDRPRRRAPLPPRAGNREDEEGEPSGNSRSRDTANVTRNGNVPREGMDRPVRIPTVWVVSGEDEEGEPRSDSRSQGKDSALWNGNVPREGTDRPRRRAPLPPRAGNRDGSGEDEEGETSGNSRRGDKDSGLRNGNVPREGMDRPVRIPTVWVVSGEDEEGEPSSDSRSQERDTDKDSATHSGNVPREGTDRPRRRAPLPPRAGNRDGSREDEEGETSSNSQSRDTANVTRNGNVLREGTDRPVCIPTVWVVSGEDEEGEVSSNSQSRDKDSALWNGNVPREGMDRPVCIPTFSVVSGEDEEGEPPRSRGTVTAAATTPGRDRRTEALSVAERREWLWQRLLQLGEDMEKWQGKPTAELAAGLARRIAATPLCSFPEGPGGTRSARWERSSGASPDPDIPSGNYGSLLIGMLRASGSAESAEEDSGSSSGSGLGSSLGSGSSSGWEQGSGASPDCDIPGGNCFIGMLRASGSAESAEEDSGLEQQQEQDEDQARSRLERRFPEVWARSRLDCGRVAEELRLDGAPVPFQRQRQLSPDEEQQMEELLREYLKQEIVVKRTSQSNNPLILYQKPHGRGVRLSLDCGALNAATPVEPQVRLDRDRLLTSINPRSHFFSVLDLSNACLAIPLASSCWHRFAFTFQGQQYLFTRLPPTFRGSGSIVHRRVAAVLSQLSPDTARGVFHYCDDILITAKRRRQLRFRTRRVLQLIQSAGFKVNREKTQLLQPEVNYLGLTLSAAGRRVLHEKLNQICQDCDAPEPWHPARLRSVLGKFNDLKEFIADYLELALPLQALAVPEKWQGQRERQWQREWQREGWERLQRLKEALKAAPTLVFPNKSRPFVIRLSVRERSVGAVLLQEKEGELLPVRHCSHKLSGQSWAPQDALCLAAARAVEAFRNLVGLAPVLIQGPAGRYLFRSEPLLEGYTCDPELPERWRLLVTTKGPEEKKSQTAPTPLAPGLQEPQWVSIPLAPALRQLPADIPKANVWFLAVEKGRSGNQSVAFAAVNLEERWLLGLRQGPEKEAAVLEALQKLQERHRSCRPLLLYTSWPRLAPRLKQLALQQQSWECHNWDPAASEVLQWLRSFPGMLQVRQVGWRGIVAQDEERWMQEATARARAVAENPVKSRKGWEPSAYERQEIVAQCHRRCHDGVQETLRRVQHVCSWRNDRQDVARWVRRCPRCQDGNPNPNPNPIPKPDPAPQRERGPWSRLRLSLCTGLLQSPEGFRALLLVQDELSGWLDAFPLREPAPPEVCRVLLHKVFGRFGSVGTVLLEPQPAWLWKLLRQPPLLGWHGRLEHAEPAEGAAPGVARVARALGKGWAAALSLIRAGFAARWVREEELGALLCIPGLPLQVRWEYPGCGNWDWMGDWGGKRKGNGKGDGDGKENELRRLRPMEIVSGYLQQVQNACSWECHPCPRITGATPECNSGWSWDWDQGLGTKIRELGSGSGCGS